MHDKGGWWSDSLVAVVGRSLHVYCWTVVEGYSSRGNCFDTLFSMFSMSVTVLGQALVAAITLLTGGCI